MTRLAMRIAALLLAVASAGANAVADNNDQHKLYLDAMQSIIEGRQHDAADALMKMIEKEPQHAGAWLDLAIIQCELGQGSEVERLLDIIENRFAPPPSIMEIITRLRAQGCRAWRPRSSFSVTLGRGHDSNVNQGASSPNFSLGTGTSRIELQLLPEFLPRSDHYTFVSGEYMREFNANGGVLFTQARALQNDSLPNFNTATLAVGVEQPWRAGAWTLRGSGLVALLGLGGHLYQTQSQAQIRITPPAFLPRKFQFNTSFGASHVKYHTLSNYDSITWETRGLLTYQSGSSQLQASLAYLSDGAQASRPGGDRKGWLASISGRTRLGDRVTTELSWTGQTWNSQFPYAPGLIDQVRQQRTQILRGVVSITIMPKHTMNIEIREVRNKENIPIFQYNSRQLQLSWQWQGF